jgi:hypothetical protein
MLSQFVLMASTSREFVSISYAAVSIVFSWASNQLIAVRTYDFSLHPVTVPRGIFKNRDACF